MGALGNFGTTSTTPAAQALAAAPADRPSTSATGDQMELINRMMNKKAQPVQQIAPGAGDALARRQQALDNSPEYKVNNAIQLAKQIQDPQERADTLYPLMKAQYVAGGG